MRIIATRDLCKDDVPQGNFNWPTFSKCALTFDPLSDLADEFNQASTNTTPFDTWTTAVLRYFLYCWQRIGNNQGELRPEAINDIQEALSILRSKI